MAEKCPYCGGEMENWKFQGRREYGMVLLPQDYKARWLFPWWNIGKHSVLLADKFSVRNGYTLNCRICRSCKKGVFDLSDQNELDRNAK